MPGFDDSIFLFILALLLVGPKKLPLLARELGKWIGEFRRASNEFKMQMEEELRQSEQADREKRIAAIEAAAPVAPALEATTDSTAETPADSDADVYSAYSEDSGDSEDSEYAEDSEYPYSEDTDNPPLSTEVTHTPLDLSGNEAEAKPASEPLPIATSGRLSIMPPETGLPTPYTRSTPHIQSDPFGDLLDSIPEAKTTQPTSASAEPSVAAPDDSAVTAAEREAHVS